MDYHTGNGVNDESIFVILLIIDPRKEAPQHVLYDLVHLLPHL